MINNYKVTVAIPHYKQEKYIVHALQSVINQSYLVDEIIVCDNCSKSNIETVINNFIRNNDRTINLIINKKNIGYQKNMNKCLELASNNYVLVLHSDDMLKQTAVEKQINVFKKNPALALVGAQEDTIDENNHIIKKRTNVKDNVFHKGQIFEFIAATNSYIPSSSVMFNKLKINEIGYFEADVIPEDELYWPKVLSMYPIAVLGESLILRRNHPEQTEWAEFFNKPNEIIDAIPRIKQLEKYEKRPELKKKIRDILNKKTSRMLVGIARSVIRHQQDSRLSYWYLKNALIIDPLLPFKRNNFFKVFLVMIINLIGLYKPLMKIKFEWDKS